MPASAQDTIMFQGTAIAIFSHEETADFAFVAADRKITRAAGSFATNYKVGQFLWASGAVANKGRVFKIETVSALEMTFEAAPMPAPADETSTTMTLRVFDGVALITSFTGPDTTNPRVDVSHSESAAREYKAGLKDNGSFSFEGNTVRGDAGFIALKTLRNNRGSQYFLIAMSDRLGFEEFLAFVETVSKTGSIDTAVTYSASLAISGDVTDSELL